MSGHVAFRRQPVPGEMMIRHQAVTLPAPVRGLVESENWAFTKPGTAAILDNWFPTQKGLKLRGGTERWAELPAPVEIVRSGFDYVSGSNHRMFAATGTRIFDVTFADNPVLQTGVGTIANGNFSTAQAATAGGDWLLAVNDLGDYIRRFNGSTWEYLDTAFAGTPGRIKADAADTNASANLKDGKGLTYVWKYRNRLFFIEGGSMNAWCLPTYAVAGTLLAIPLSGAAKRGGSLLFGASWSTGDSGDSGDDKCIFMTDQGEVLVFVGTDPSSALNWRQEGRYDISKPLSKNGHQQLGADVLIITVDGIVPLSAAVQKDVTALSLSAITYNIEQTWMQEFRTKGAYPWTIAKWDEGDMLVVNFPGGQTYNTKTVAASNLHTGAWARFIGWDAMCWMQLRGSLFFGTQDGKIIQVDSTGFDDSHWDVGLGRYVGNVYACTMVGGWEMFQSPPHQVTWFQARAAFFSSIRETFEPQLAATTDYEFRIPPPPSVGAEPELLDVWDEGLWGPGMSDTIAPKWATSTAYTVGTRAHDALYGYWDCAIAHTSAASGTFKADRDANLTYWTFVTPQPSLPPPTAPEIAAYAQWDQPGAGAPRVRNTMWVSIGETGFSHAPICQASIGQQVKPDVELISISATFLRMAANV